MGLDMYLYKCRKMKDFSAMDYYFANEAFGYYEEKELAKANHDNFPFSLSDWGIPETMTEEKLNHYKIFIQKNLLSLKKLLLGRKLIIFMVGLLIIFKMEMIIATITS